MANQTNYQSNIQELSNSYTRYLVSRTIANTKDDLLDMEVPADFSEALLQNTVEVNLYSLADNSLIFSDVVKNVSGSIYVETLQYEDNSSPILIQIFNQEGANDLTLPTSPVKIDSSSLYQNFSSGSGQKLVQYNFDDDDGSRIGINTIMQNVLDDAYPIALKTVEDMIFVSGSTSFTETELSQYVVDAIDIAYDAALADEAQNPQNYRFDLI